MMQRRRRLPLTALMDDQVVELRLLLEALGPHNLCTRGVGGVLWVREEGRGPRRGNGDATKQGTASGQGQCMQARRGTHWKGRRSRGEG